MSVVTGLTIQRHQNWCGRMFVVKQEPVASANGSLLQSRFQGTPLVVHICVEDFFDGFCNLVGNGMSCIAHHDDCLFLAG